jgi:nicotinate phosphoribosyltransferase
MMNPLTSPLLTDLYQLTMLQAYFARGMAATAVFEFFVRRLPPERNFLVAAGLEQVLDYLENLHFSDDELAWIREYGLFQPEFAEHLHDLKFTGDVHAMPEGTAFFPGEPILRIIAPLPQAQLVETRVLNLLHFQTMIASKAARCVLTAPGRQLVDFGLRRAHGAEAGLLAARACYLAGFAGTATVLAGATFGIPLFGTMAHSYVQACDDESDAFLEFARLFPRTAVFLIDTYDTERAAQKVAALAPQLRAAGIAVKGVRIDSGDLPGQARSVRRTLDAAGLRDTTIFASGNLDEYRVRNLLEAGAPIDGFGIGTALVTSSDAPYLEAVYKLQEYAGLARRKRSTGKETLPGRKQVYRRYRPDGLAAGDTLTLEHGSPDGRPLLEQVMRSGKRLRAAPPLDAIRAYARDEISALPEPLRALERCATPYTVEVARELHDLAADFDTAGNGGATTA